MIKTKNLVLRHYRKSDEKQMMKKINDRLISRYMCNVPHPYKKKDAKKWYIDCKKSKKSGKGLNFTIEMNKEYIGGISLSDINLYKAELGYWIDKEHWNKGLMTEAINGMTSFGFKKLKLKRIYAYVFEKNKASARLLEKNAFKKEGFLKKDRIKNGKFIDVYLYAKTK